MTFDQIIANAGLFLIAGGQVAIFLALAIGVLIGDIMEARNDGKQMS